jgi:hypothetical protein
MHSEEREITKGELAYRLFCENRHLDPATGEQKTIGLPPWSILEEEAKRAWNTVAEHLFRLGEIAHANRRHIFPAPETPPAITRAFDFDGDATESILPVRETSERSTREPEPDPDPE